MMTPALVKYRYTEFAEDGDKIHSRRISFEDFNSYLTRYEFEDGILMNILLDKNGEVVLIKEPYTP